MKVSLEIKNSAYYSEAPQIFNSLLKKYHDDFDHVSEFYKNSPKNMHTNTSVPMPASIGPLGNVLMEYNKKLGADQKTLDNIELLKNSQARVIVSGQQPALMTGPMLVIYKALSAVHAAQELSKESSECVVPIFWNASEDHNIAELDHTFFMGRDGSPIKLTMPFGKESDGKSIGQLPLRDTPEVDVFFQELEDAFVKTEFTEELMSLLKNTYKKAETYADWFGMLMLKIFKGTGLIMLDPHLVGIKKLISPVIERAIKHPVVPSKLVNEVGDELASRGFGRQITKKENQCAFFLYNSDNKRERVEFSDGKFTTETAVYTESELLEVLKKQPERFSPNVILRPILSEYILPTISYMAGPAELSYYAQLKKLYMFFNVEMPIIQSRLSMSILEGKIQKILERFNFSPTDLLGDTTALVTEYVKENNRLASAEFWDNVKLKINDVLDSVKVDIRKSDPASLNAVESISQKIVWQLGKMESKVIQNQRSKEKELSEALEKVKRHLKPKNSLQERKVNIFYYMNKYGFDFFEALKKEAPSDYTRHHFITVQTKQVKQTTG